jgi:hypothetical protein
MFSFPQDIQRTFERVRECCGRRVMPGGEGKKEGHLRKDCASILTLKLCVLPIMDSHDSIGKTRNENLLCKRFMFKLLVFCFL